MQIILASAKTMYDKLNTMPDVAMSVPRFQREAEAFAQDMCQYPEEAVADMLKCSLQIARQNKFRFMQFFGGVEKMPAKNSLSKQSLRNLNK